MLYALFANKIWHWNIVDCPSLCSLLVPINTLITVYVYAYIFIACRTLSSMQLSGTLSPKIGILNTLSTLYVWAILEKLHWTLNFIILYFWMYLVPWLILLIPYYELWRIVIWMTIVCLCYSEWSEVYIYVFPI